MAIKLSSQVAGLGDVAEVTAEASAIIFSQNAFTNALLAFKNSSDFAGSVWLLHATRHPIQEILRESRVAGADVVAQVGDVQTTAPLLRLTPESSP